MYMDSTTIYWESLNTVASLPRPTTSSSVTILTVESNPSKLFAFFSATRSSILRTSSYLEEITSVLRSTESMVSTMNANVDTLLDSGASLATSSIACLSRPSSTRKFSACTVDWVRNWRTSTKSKTSCGQQTSPTLASSAIYSGPILKGASKPMEITTEASRSHSVSKSFASSARNTTWTWFAARIK